MHFTTFIYTLLTLAVTSTTAIPLSSGTPAIPSPKTKSSNLASSPVSAAATPSPTLVGAYQCPPNKYKRCCMSVQESSRELLTKVGDLVPALGGIAVSSQISFSCKGLWFSPSSFFFSGMQVARTRKTIHFSNIAISSRLDHVGCGFSQHMQ